MTTKKFEAVLAAALDGTDEMHDGTIRRLETFEEVGVLTTDPGLVVTFEDGSQIQLTIVRSRRKRDGSHPDEESHDDEDDDGTFAHAARVNGLR